MKKCSADYLQFQAIAFLLEHKKLSNSSRKKNPIGSFFARDACFQSIVYYSKFSNFPLTFGLALEILPLGLKPKFKAMTW
jgi:hypothetical protein